MKAPRAVATVAAALVLTLGLAAPAAAAMDVATFLTKVTALKARGIGALFSSDVGLLKRESAAAVTSIAAEQKARKATGRPLLYCAPDKNRMTADEMIAGLERIPPAQRTMPLRDGFVRVIAARHPCP